MTDLDVKSFGPRPNDQTILPDGPISMTRLLNWSAIRILPRSLNSRFNFRLSAEAARESAMIPTAATTVRTARKKDQADLSG
jgi:hypothetical protein